MTMAATEGGQEDGGNATRQEKISRFPSIQSSTSVTSSEWGGCYNQKDAHTNGLGSRSSSLAYSSDRSSTSSSPTKLPSLDVFKANSVCSLASKASSIKGSFRSEMCRSPSCPVLWSDFEEEVEKVEYGSLNASIHPVMTRQKGGSKDCRFTLPSIFPSTKSCRSDNSTLTPKIEKELRSIALRNSDSGFSLPPKPEKTLQTQMSQPTGLLLPMRDNTRTKERSKKKCRSKGKKHAPITVKSDSFASSNISSQSDSGISTGMKPSEKSDTSEWGIWVEDEEYDDEEEAVELEINDETPRYSIAKDIQETKENISVAEPDRSELMSQDKCREWLEGVNSTGPVANKVKAQKA